MYENEAVSGGIYMGGSDYTNEMMFRELPPPPTMRNDGPTDEYESTAESCIRKNWSITFKVSLLGLVGLLFIFLIIACALLAAAPVPEEEEKQANKKEPEKDMLLLEPEKDTCPAGWNRRGDSCYSFSIETDTWEGSFISCIQQQSKLLVLRTREEMNSLLPLMNGKTYWFGLKKFQTKWLWFDATPLNFSDWSPTEPNNAGGNESCVELRSKGWNDIDCDIKLRYICKK